MSLPASRAVLRQSSRLTGRTARRFESTTTKATEAAKDAAAKTTEAAKEGASKVADYTSKASEGLSKVTSSAGPAIAGAAKGVSNALGKIGGRTGRLIAFVQRKSLLSITNSSSGGFIGAQWLTSRFQGQIPPTIYYARVGLELSKLVFHGQKMTPP
jgi:F-type H+-transporting ATPase subunit g